MEFPKLYKRTSAGKIQMWHIEVKDDSYRTTSGQVDGKKRTSKWTVCKGKNTGKANETTSEEQAIAQAESMITKQKKKGYHENIDNVDKQKHFKPMLASKWEDRRDKIEDDRVFIQPKLDGMRCVVTKDGMFTRNGEEVISAPHIREELNLFFNLHPEVILDGELYNHKFKHDFNKIMSLCRKTKPTKTDLEESKKLIEFHIYDMYHKTFGGYRERYELVQHAAGLLTDMTEKVETRYIKISEVDDHANDFIAMGYEVAMIRLVDSKYENKRSKFLIKWKEMQDEEFVVVDVIEGQGNKTGMAASVRCLLPDGRAFSAGMIGTEEFCQDFLCDKSEHIGKKATIVFQNYTPDGIPRFPKFKAIRDYE